VVIYRGSAHRPAVGGYYITPMPWRGLRFVIVPVDRVCSRLPPDRGQRCFTVSFSAKKQDQAAEQGDSSD